MIKLRQNLRDDYSPLYFLASLGAGGLTVSFFMYLMFMTPHPQTPIPTWESWLAVLQGDHHWALQALTVIALGGVLAMAALHIRLLLWNITEYRQFKQTDAYQSLFQSNAEVQLMAIPLTLAMAVNVGFILGALFVPGLWSVVEYLFPAALIAFAAIAVYGSQLFLNYMTRLLTTGSFDNSRNNNLSQMLSVFAFSMIAVGFAAPAAMSTTALTAGIGLILSLLFLSVTAVLGLITLVSGFRAMLEYGVDKEGSASLWIMIPILTVVGIALYRLGMGMHHSFDLPISNVQMLAFFSVLVSVQLIFAVLGYRVMRQMGYFSTYVSGSGQSKAAFSLICPGVAGFVLAFFLLHKGLVANELLTANSLAYFLILLPLVGLQIKTILTLFQLGNKLLVQQASTSAQTAPAA